MNKLLEILGLYRWVLLGTLCFYFTSGDVTINARPATWWEVCLIGGLVGHMIDSLTDKIFDTFVVLFNRKG